MEFKVLELNDKLIKFKALELNDKLYILRNFNRNLLFKDK